MFYYLEEKEKLRLFAQEKRLDCKKHPYTVDEVSEKEFYKIGKQENLLFFVSQSKVKTFRRCHMEYNYKYIKKLRKRIKGKPLYIGSIVHEAIENWLLDSPWKKPITKARKEIDGMFVEEAVELEEVVPLSTGLVKGYIDQYENDGLTPVHVELQVRVPLVDNIIFEGKIDSLQRENKTGRLWQVEHKTCKSIPDEKNRMSDIQTILYHWALPIMGYEKPIGVIWDYLRKKLPVVPELLKKGGLSKSKQMDTTYDVYKKAIMDNGLDFKDYKEHLETLKGREDNFFRRIKMAIAQSTVDSVVEDFKSTAIQMREIGHTAKDRNMTRDCSWCDYYKICQSELRGGDTEQLIKQYYTKEDKKYEKKVKRKKYEKKVKTKKKR